MSLYSDPPALESFRHDKPTLLVCWWATIFCALMILLRLAGRFIRTERLFSEDRIAALALIPLFLRMGCVHFILMNGTNNADFTGANLTDDQLRKKAIASGLTLASRPLYAATLWILKGTILAYLQRLTDLTWQAGHKVTLVVIRWCIVGTFVAVLISGLAECQPFDHYWQVLPDPGGRCRQGYAQLITMAVCNVVTDLMLIIFPIPIIISSNMSVRRKIQLVLLFCLSLSVVIVTLYRVPRVVGVQGAQQYRSLLASVELIFATASANALVLGSFVRDRGVKKQKFRRPSAADSFDRSSNPRRPTLHRNWGSDEDLVRDIGLNVDRDLQMPDSPASELYPHPQPFTPMDSGREQEWEEPPSSPHMSEDMMVFNRSSVWNTDKRLSLFDVGGLLEESVGSSSGSYRKGSQTSSTLVDPSSPSLMTPSVKASTLGVRRGSNALLQDIGGLLGPTKTTRSSKFQKGTELQPIPQSHMEYSSRKGSGGGDLELNDAGGLLS